MGLSSNARLLSITARLTSNEYESQKIANAKMRLATQSQEASRDYINALNTQKLVFMTYDAQGNAVTTDLSAGYLYQYSDSKNQYALSNIAGQILIKNEDRVNFEASRNLEAFLEANGVTKSWKNEKLAQAKEKMDSYKGYKTAWDEIVNDYKTKNYENVSYNIGELTTKEDTEEKDAYDEDGYREFYKGGCVYGEYESLTSEDAWELEKTGKWNEYVIAYNTYNDTLSKYLSQDQTTNTSGEVTGNTSISESVVEELYDKQNDAYVDYTPYVTYDSWIEMQAKNDNEVAYNNYQLYKDAAAEFNAEVEKYSSINESYSYSDASKAQWYTNLWYRLNGESSEKSAIGDLGANYAVLEDNLLNSTTWLQDALAQGTIILESASYKNATDEIPDMVNPSVVNLKGISWESRVYSACTDIKTEDDNAAIAKAEAEYEAKTRDITAKEKKFDSKIRKLETEHEAIKQEYDSVKQALSANISRSYKTFNS